MHTPMFSQLEPTSQGTSSCGSVTGVPPRMLSALDGNNPHHQQVMRRLQSVADENLM